MVAVRRLTRAAIAVLLVAGTAVWQSCGEPLSDSPTAPAPPPSASARELQAAVAVHQRHSPALLDIPGVVGTAIGLGADGRPEFQILLERPGVAALPTALDGIRVRQRVTGRIMAWSNPRTRQRPAPAGFSVGHPAVTAGTIGARVVDPLGRVYILSNNHVLANSNNAQIGDAAYQPGPFDGGTAADQIATLSDFQAITFGGSGNNTIDAAIALSTTALLDNAVPADDGYGMPNSTMYGDANGDGMFDDPSALLGVNVQKYGRTTSLTHGQITGVQATVTVCYEVSGFSCTKSARFVNQLLVAPAGFSDGGDSGSLLVTDNANLNPVALLFAGSSTVTIANRIDLVLARFGVRIDGFDPPPPGPLTDVAVSGISVPGVVVVNSSTAVAVTVKNFGNQDVAGFDVTLEDTTEHVTLGTQTVGTLVAGATATLSFTWSPAAAGDHELVARHTLSDDRAINDERGAILTVAPAVTDLAMTSISVGGTAIQGHTVNVAVTVANIGNQHMTDSFDVILRDTTAGVTLGTRTVAGLARGANTTLTFSWDLTAAPLGVHILFAAHSLTDDLATNNQRTADVTVNPPPTDLALTAITAPTRVTVGDTAHVMVTVANVGEVDVTTSFNVELKDGSAGSALVGTGTVAGLAAGTTTTVDIPWNTAGAAISTHILIATQKLPDNVATNNSVAVAVQVQAPPDLAVSGVTAPAAITVGGTAPIEVTVANVGGQHVGAFDLIVTDATAGVTIGTVAIPALAMSSSTTRTFNWNTSTAALGSHTLVARHTLPDVNAANDQASATVTVNAPSIDVAVTALNAPATVARGSTAAIGVTVQNVGGQVVSATFDIVLSDATAGTTLGTASVAGLAAGAQATRSFNWNTASPPAALGNHTLVATITLIDAAAANNQRTATVNVQAQPADLALASLTAPSQVTVGDTVPVVVTVANAGGQDVTANFDLELKDGTTGVTIGTETIPGLALGGSATRTFLWSTAGLATGGHILLATQKLADANSSNNSRAVIITVNPPSLHVGNLTGSGAANGGIWTATVRIDVHNAKHAAVGGVTVSGTWSGSNTVGECVTDATGACSVVFTLPITTSSVWFSMNGLTLPGAVYKNASNHDPDGSSNGFSIFVRRP